MQKTSFFRNYSSEKLSPPRKIIKLVQKFSIASSHKFKASCRTIFAISTANSSCFLLCSAGFRRIYLFFQSLLNLEGKFYQIDFNSTKHFFVDNDTDGSMLAQIMAKAAAKTEDIEMKKYEHDEQDSDTNTNYTKGTSTKGRSRKPSTDWSSSDYTEYSDDKTKSHKYTDKYDEGK